METETPKRGRPRNTTLGIKHAVIHVRVSPRVMNRLRQYQATNGMGSVSEAARRVLEVGLFPTKFAALAVTDEPEAGAS